MPADPERSGYSFTGWNTMLNGLGAEFTATTPVNTSITVYALWSPDDGKISDDDLALLGFNTEHIQYISGYEDSSMRPDNAMTRAEVAVIFYRLLATEEKSVPRSSNFSDVDDEVWYSQAVSYLADIDVLTGYSDGTFEPNQPVTRAEFATIVSRFYETNTMDSRAFPDIEGHWAEEYINLVAEKGWANGYPDGTFKPQQNITRAEAVKIVNLMLNRKIEREDIPEGINEFADIENHWAYTHLVEASNNHEVENNNDGYEIWCE